MIKGFVDQLDRAHATGWCMDEERADPMEVAVLYKNQEICRTCADLYRRDLETVNPGGRCSFSCDYPPVANPAYLNVVAVDQAGNYSPLPWQGRIKPVLNNVDRLENPSAILWGSWPFFENYSAMATEKIFSQAGGNSGNLAFTTAIVNHIHFSDQASWEETPPENAITVIPCANQLGTHIDISGFLNEVEKTKCAIVGIGLGAQAEDCASLPDLPQETLRWLATMVERAPIPGYPNISLRGHFTQKVLEKYGFGDAGVVLGCPSLFINRNPDLGQIISSNFRTPRRVAVCAGNYNIAGMSRIEASLARMVEDSMGIYIVQHPLGLARIARGEISGLSMSERNVFHEYTVPYLDEFQLAQWARQYTRIFFNIDAWLEELSHFDFVIGARIHGVMLGLQAGVPSVCIAFDSRTRELCEVMHIPYVTPDKIADGVTINDLERLFTFDPVDFDKNRKMLAKRYIDFLTGNRLKIQDWLNNFNAAQ